MIIGLVVFTIHSRSTFICNVVCCMWVDTQASSIHYQWQTKQQQKERERKERRRRRRRGEIKTRTLLYSNSKSSHNKKYISCLLVVGEACSHAAYITNGMLVLLCCFDRSLFIWSTVATLIEFCWSFRKIYTKHSMEKKRSSCFSARSRSLTMRHYSASR